MFSFLPKDPFPYCIDCGGTYWASVHCASLVKGNLSESSVYFWNMSWLLDTTCFVLYQKTPKHFTEKNSQYVTDVNEQEKITSIFPYVKGNVTVLSHILVINVNPLLSVILFISKKCKLAENYNQDLQWGL